MLGNVMKIIGNLTAGDIALIRLREVDARAWAWIENRPFSELTR
jgi:hypothetical protein